MIYLVTNLLNGKKYIGKTIKGVARRWQLHVAAATHGSLFPLHRAIRKYGAQGFSLEVIDAGPFPSDCALAAAEIYWIARHQSVGRGYNATHGGEGGIHTAETREKQRLAAIGNKRACGAVRSADFRAKLRAANLGKTLSPEHRAKLSAAHKGKVISEESRRRMSISRTGKKQLWRLKP